MQNGSSSYPNTHFNPDRLESATLALYQVFLTIAIILGIPGNILVIWINTRMTQKSPMDIIITYISINDLIPLFVQVPMKLSESTKFWFVYGSDWLCKATLFVGQVTTFTSAFILIVIAIERYRQICRNKAAIRTRSAAKKICLMLTVVTILIAVPNTVAHGTVKGGSCGVKSGVYRMLLSIYIIALALIIMSLSTLVVILYSLIAKTLWSYLTQIGRNASKDVETSITRIVPQPKTKAHLQRRTDGNTDVPSYKRHRILPKPAFLRANKIASIHMINNHENTSKLGVTDSHDFEVPKILLKKASKDFVQNESRSLSRDKSISQQDEATGKLKQKGLATGNYMSNLSLTIFGQNRVKPDETEVAVPNRRKHNRFQRHFLSQNHGKDSQADVEDGINPQKRKVSTINVASKCKIEGDISKRNSRNNQNPLTGTNNIIERNRQRTIRTTKLVFAVSLVFILSWIPPLVAGALSGVLRTGLGDTMYQAYVFMLNTPFLSLFMNPILYYCMNNRFRQQVLELLTNIKMFRNT